MGKDRLSSPAGPVRVAGWIGYAVRADPWSGHPTGGAALPDPMTATIAEVLAREWGRRGRLRSLASGSTARVWRLDNEVVRVVWAPAATVEAGLRAAAAISSTGLAAGAPVRTRSGALSVSLQPGDASSLGGRPRGAESMTVAVLEYVPGRPGSMHDVAPAELGALLGRIHTVLHPVDPVGALSVRDVLGHMRRGILTDQPTPVRALITGAVDAVRDWYRAEPRRRQLLRGDGPELLVDHTGAITAMIDWGGVRHGSVVDDIGCWTLHGATGPIARYTTEFLGGYTSRAPLTTTESNAVPLFQRLRLASRACHVADAATCSTVLEWAARTTSW